MSWFGRAELGETDDPTDLVPGSAAKIDESVSNMRKLAKAFQEANDGLTKLDTNDWQGEAAEKFNSYFADELPKWRDAAEAFVPAADALTTYKGAVERGQRDAAEAIRLYNEAKQATEQAKKQYEAAADEHDRAAFAATFSNDAAPSPMAPFSDPGQAKRESAQRLLEDARNAVKNAAGEAAGVITKAKDRAPEKPGFLTRLGATVEDLVDTAVNAQTALVTGVVEGVAGIGKQFRAINPLDPYNLTHPGQYAANMATMASGVVGMAAHPIDAVKAIANVEGWKNDPFAAAGKLIPDIALAALTEGAGTAGTAARTAGREAAEVGAREAVETGAREAAEQTGTQARRHFDDGLDNEGYSKLPDEPHTPREPDLQPHDKEPELPEHKDPDPQPEEPKHHEPDEAPDPRDPSSLGREAQAQYEHIQNTIRQLEDTIADEATSPGYRAYCQQQVGVYRSQLEALLPRGR